MNWKRVVILIWISSTAALCETAYAEAVSEQAIDQLMDRHMASRHIPGASIAIVQNGRMVLAKGYGLADIELNVRADDNIVYELGSISKQFTSTAIMLLVEEGKLSLDEKVAQILDDMPSAWGDVTVRHLLTHTSGIRNFSNLPVLLAAPRTDVDNQDVIALVSGFPLEFPPGENWRYTNTGYYLLGMVIEAKSGMRYDQFLQDRIFFPLSMISTRVNSRREVVPGRARGYVEESGRILNAEYQSPTQPFAAGAIVSTVIDLARWEAAIDSATLLDQSTIALMSAPTRLHDGTIRPYGYGWDLTPYHDAARVSHGGVILGFSTYFTRFVDSNLTIIVLVNLQRGGAQSIAESIAELYLPRLRGRHSSEIEDKDPKLTAYLRTVVESVADGRGETQWFTPEWIEFFFPDRIKEGKQLLGNYGALNAFVLIDDKIEDGRRVRAYDAVFGTVPLRLNLTVSTDGKVAGIGIQSMLN